MESGIKNTIWKLRDIQSSSEMSDTELANAEIRSHEAAITLIDLEIDELMRTVRQLHFKKWEHTEEIRRYKGLITLARRLPYEILASIFEICVRDGYTRTPLIVSHVCSRWRKAASIPSVWSHIYVDFDSRNPYNRTRFWLGKAGDSYLRITLEIPAEQFILSKVMDLLLEKRSQWRSLTVNSALLANVNRALVMCAGFFPELRSFHASVQQGPSDHTNQEEGEQELVALRTAFSGAPNFSAVHITRNTLPNPHIIPSSVTHLYLHLWPHHSSVNLSILPVIRVLEALPKLQVFSLVLSPGQVRHFEPVEDAEHFVSLPYLHSITLTGWPDIYNLLLHLMAPNLKALHLRSPDDQSGRPYEGTGLCLLRFLERASPALEELELRDADIPAPYLVQCLARMEYLQTLRLHESEISSSILKELSGHYGICPSLSTLDLRWCGHFSGRTLVDLVRSRLRLPIRDAPLLGMDAIRSICTPIVKVTVINCSFVKKQDIEDLASMTVCQVVVRDPNDYCRAVGCCVNDRYRKRLAMEGIGRAGRLIL